MYIHIISVFTHVDDIKVPSTTPGRSSGDPKNGPLSVGATALLALVFGIIVSVWYCVVY